MQSDELAPETPSPAATSPPYRQRMVRQGGMGGIGLVLAGIFFLLNNLFPMEMGRVFLLLVGVAFFLAYLLGSRRVGFLIPGGIVSGLGLGTLLAQWLPGRESGGITLLGLGLGFGSIWVLERHHQWSLLTGAILTAIGVFVLAGDLAEFRDVGRWWPVVLVLVGGWLLFRRAQAASKGD